ncbi:hypothetical protein BH18THE2_BH18THE2_05110 [soil metagenome]
MSEKQLPKNNMAKPLLFGVVICLLLILSPSFLFGVFSFAFADEATRISEQHFFKNSKGNLNIAGLVKNDGNMPVHVIVGLNITSKISVNDTRASTDQHVSTIQNTTYSRIVFPSTSSPFKFAVPPDSSIIQKAFISDVQEFPVPLYDNLVLNYSNVPVADNKALVGTVKNVGLVDIHNVSIYASVHNKNRTQIDSVKSNLIPVLKPGQESAFNAIPDPTLRGEVEYFSCAGLDFDQPINTLRVDDDEFIPYDLRAIAKISTLEYVNSTDSISFGVKHYNPEGGDLSLKVPQLSANQTIFIMMDDKTYDKPSIRMDGKTINIDLFVPPGDHEINIQGIRNRM